MKAASECFFGHDVVEIVFADFPTVSSCPLEHLLEFLDIHGLSQLLGHSSDVVRIYVSGMVVVEQVKDLVYTVLNNSATTLDSLSPNFDVIPSKNS